MTPHNNETVGGTEFFTPDYISLIGGYEDSSDSEGNVQEFEDQQVEDQMIDGQGGEFENPHIHESYLTLTLNDLLKDKGECQQHAILWSIFGENLHTIYKKDIKKGESPDTLNLLDDIV